MKNLLKTIALATLVVCSTGCETDEMEFLDNPNEESTDISDADLITSNIQRTFNDVIGDYDYPSRRIIRQAYQFSTYLGHITDDNHDNIWSNTYQLFSNVDELQDIDEATASEGGIPYHVGMAQVLEAYSYMLLVDYFGEVPFSQALLPDEFPNPVLDAGASIYAAQLTLLDEAIANLNEGDTNQALVPSDLYYGTFTSANWIALANTLKIRAYLNVGNAAGINAALADNIIDQNNEDFQFEYPASTNPNPDSAHPFFNHSYGNGGVGIYLSNQLYDFMNVGDNEPPFIETETPKDPRARYYFYRPTGNSPSGIDYPCEGSNIHEYCYVGNGYWGRDHADDEGLAWISHLNTAPGLYPGGGAFDANQFLKVPYVRYTDASLAGAGIRPIYLATFTHFALAEGALTLGSNGNPRDLLETGIRKSMAKVSGFATNNGIYTGGFEMTVNDINNYVDAVLSEYDSVNNDGKLAIIAREYFIAAWGNGIEPYNLYKRTGLPDLQTPIIPAGDFPRSFLYPESIVNNNPNIDQREVTTKVFWDTTGYLD